MRISDLIPSNEINIETLQLCIALDSLTVGEDIQFSKLDVDALALALCSLMLQLETVKPGVVEQYGWVRLAAIQEAAETISAAMQVKPPEGLS